MFVHEWGVIQVTKIYKVKTMEIKMAEKQARTYVYDLMNEAKEHGFRADDKWKLSLVNEAEKHRLQKEYHPAIVNKVSPEAILEVFHNVKPALRQSLSKEDLLLDTKTILDDNLNYIVAFNPNRSR
jgi:hypothetical protein